MGRGDDAHAHRAIDLSADAPHVAVFERAEEPRLQRQWELGDLVEEETAAVGALERAGVLRDGSGEGAPLVAQKLALGQIGGHRAAVEDDERPAALRGLFVNRAREDVFADARFTDERDGDVRAHQAFEQVEDLVHRAGAGDDTPELPRLAGYARQRQMFGAARLSEHRRDGRYVEGRFHTPAQAFGRGDQIHHEVRRSWKSTFMRQCTGRVHSPKAFSGPKAASSLLSVNGVGDCELSRPSP